MTPRVQASSSRRSALSASRPGSPANNAASSPARSRAAKIRATVRTWAVSLGARLRRRPPTATARPRRRRSARRRRAPEPGLERPDARWSAQRGSSRSARTTGMPVSAWPPTEPAPSSFQHGCALDPVDEPALRRARPVSWRRGACAPRKGPVDRAGQPQNGNGPPETRRLSAAATSKRLLSLSLVVVDEPAISSQIARHGGPARPSRRGEAGRIAEREVEAGEDPLAAFASAAASISASSTVPRAGSAGSSSRLAVRRRAGRSRCCRARSSACSPRSNRPSGRCRTASRHRADTDLPRLAVMVMAVMADADGHA